MQLIKSLFVLGALAIPALAQDSDSCDPQNDNNNDATCTGQTIGSQTRTQTRQQATTDVNGRVTSYAVVSTIVQPVLGFTTDVVSDVVVTTNPKSIYTTTYTSREVYTITNAQAITSVYTSIGTDNMPTTGTTVIPAQQTSDNDDDDDDNDDNDNGNNGAAATTVVTSSTSNPGVPAATAGVLAPAMGFAGFLALAAAL